MIALAQAALFESLAEILHRFAPEDLAAKETPLRYPVYDPESDFPAEPEGFLSMQAIPETGGSPGACIVGIIDDAIPFAHARLRTGPVSRIASIWLQGAAGMAPGGGVHAAGRDLPFGRELRGQAIDGLLSRHGRAGSVDETALYAEAGAIDHRRTSRQSHASGYSHGAATADIAAGFAPGDPDARQFPIIAVSLPPAVTRDTSGTFIPYYVLLATLHILHRARRLCRWIEQVSDLEPLSVRLPVVVNLSYGLTAGPKDGGDFIAKFQDAVTIDDVADIGPVRFVLPMGNHRQSRSVAGLAPGETVDWLTLPDDRTPSFIEFWSTASVDPVPMRITVTPPGADAGVTTGFDGFGQFCDLDLGGRHLARAYLQRHERKTGSWRQCLTLAVPPTIPTDAMRVHGRPGRWILRLDSGEAVEASIQRDDSMPGSAGSGGRQSYFHTSGYEVFDEVGRRIDEDDGSARVTRLGTLNALACGNHQIRVGGVTGSGDPAFYSGLGRRDDRQPHGTAQAISDRSLLRRGVVTMGLRSGSRQVASGTSVAAPAIARAEAYRLAGLTVPEPVRRLYEY